MNRRRKMFMLRDLTAPLVVAVLNALKWRGDQLQWRGTDMTWF